MDNFSNHIFDVVTRLGVFKTIQKLAIEKEADVFLVGGYVRDLIIGRKSKDIDIVVVGSGTGFAEAFAKMTGAKKITVFKNFGTAQVKFKSYEIEFVGARKESYRYDSRKPIVEDGSLYDDLLRRDFTINTLAVGLGKDNFGKLVDTFHGLDDIKNKMIRTHNDSDITFSDDPLRMFRAIRFACQLSFSLAPGLMEAIIRNKDRIHILSAERISDELNKIILSDIPSKGFYLLDQCGLLEMVLPELTDLKGAETVDNISHKDNFSHTLQVLDNLSEVSNNLWLRWTALLHDVGKPATKKFDEKAGWTFYNHEVVGSKMVISIFKRLKLPLNEKMKYVRKLVYLHLRPAALTGKDVTDSAVRRLIVEAGNDIEDLIVLAKADVTSKNKEKVNIFKRRFDKVSKKIKEVTEKDKLRNWKNPITGRVIMDTFDIGPSRTIGELKESIKEAIMEGEIKNDFEQAFELLLSLGKNRGLMLRK